MAFSLGGCGGPLEGEGEDVDVTTSDLAWRPANSPGRFWIGVVPKFPTGGVVVDPRFRCNFDISFKMDNEDDGNMNYLSNIGTITADTAATGKGINRSIGGIAHVPGSVAGGNTVITYCHEGVTSLPRTRWPYAVLAGQADGTLPSAYPDCGMSKPACPPGSFAFTRVIDDEDSNNANQILPPGILDGLPNQTWGGGLSYPATSTRGCDQEPVYLGSGAPKIYGTSGNGATRLSFCFVPDDATAPTNLPAVLPAWNQNTFQVEQVDFGERYLFFTARSPQTKFTAYQDDEDNENLNKWYDYSVGKWYLPSKGLWWDAAQRIWTPAPALSDNFQKMLEIVGGGPKDTAFRLGWEPTTVAPAQVDRGTASNACKVGAQPSCTDLKNPTCAASWAAFAWDAGKYVYCRL